MMILKHFLFVDSEEVNSFLVACPETRKAMIIDAGGLDEDLKRFAKENDLDVQYLFITHDHRDHTGGVKQVFQLFPDMELISLQYSFGRGNIRRPVDGDEFRLGELNGTFHHIPGHSDDMMVLYLSGHLFTGDALFAGSVGETSSEENYRRQIQDIRAKLLIYPDETVIHPGHGPDSTIGLEKSFNPFL